MKVVVSAILTGWGGRSSVYSRVIKTDIVEWSQVLRQVSAIRDVIERQYDMSMDVAHPKDWFSLTREDPNSILCVAQSTERGTGDVISIWIRREKARSTRPTRG